MQLKIRRSQRDAGVVPKKVVFCLNARADLSDFERANLARYKLYDQVIYNSEASRRQLDKGYAASADGSVRGGLMSLVHVGLAALRLNITVRGLERGQYIECKSLDELLGAEAAIMEACRNLKTYLDTAATFDGTEMVVDFSGGEPRIVAQAVRPEPILAPTVTNLTAGPALVLTDSLEVPVVATERVSPKQFQSAADPPARRPTTTIVSRISDATGLSEGQASTVALLFLVALLAFCFAMFHG